MESQKTKKVHKKELVTRMDPQVRTGSRDNNEKCPDAPAKNDVMHHKRQLTRTFLEKLYEMIDTI